MHNPKTVMMDVGDAKAIRTQLFAKLALVQDILYQMRSNNVKAAELNASDMEDFVEKWQDFSYSSTQLILNNPAISKNDAEYLARDLDRAYLSDVLSTKLGRQWRWKPRGYAGCFETIQMMYDFAPSATDAATFLLELAEEKSGAFRAVRWRREDIRKIIGEVINHSSASGRCEITSLACGPAAEVFDAAQNLSLETLERIRAGTTNVVFWGVDIDFSALGFVMERRKAKPLPPNITLRLRQANLIRAIEGREAMPMKEQDLVYTLGFSDYLNDSQFVDLINLAYDRLKPGGEFLCGNFHIQNANRFYMETCLDWPLIHRSERDLERIFDASKFSGTTPSIYTDPTSTCVYGRVRK